VYRKVSFSTNIPGLIELDAIHKNPIFQ